MIKSMVMPLFLLASCSLFAVSCSQKAELYYDASEYAVEIKGYGFKYPDEIEYAECCVVFDTLKLQNYAGWKIVSIKVFNPDPNAGINYTPLVYEARAGLENPDTLLSINENPTEVTSLNWKTISLDKPVTIEASMDFWAGYRVAPQTGQYPLAVGSEPSYDNSYLSSDVLGAFVPVTENWVIRIVVER